MKELDFSWFEKACEVKTVISVDYNDIDIIINQYFDTGSAYECVAYQEWCNDESHEISVGGDPLSEKDAESIRVTKKYNHYSLNRILDYLADKGIIPMGEYVIKVYW